MSRSAAVISRFLPATCSGSVGEADLEADGAACLRGFGRFSGLTPALSGFTAGFRGFALSGLSFRPKPETAGAVVVDDATVVDAAGVLGASDRTTFSPSPRLSSCASGGGDGDFELSCSAAARSPVSSCRTP